MANLCPAVGANRDLAYVRETTFKQTPTTPFFKYLRTTGDSLQGTVETQQSNELRKGRTTSAPVKGRSSAAGDISFEMSYRSFDDFLCALMFNTKEANTELTYQDGDTVSPSRVAVGGQWQLKLGQKDQSFTIMKLFSDKKLYRFYKGCMVNSFSLSVPLDGMVSGSFNLLGANNPRVLDYNIVEDANAIDAMGMTFDPETPHKTDQFNSFVGTLKSIHLVDGSGTEVGEDVGYATQIDLQVAHDLSQDYAIFDEEAICVSPQRFNVTGTITMYLKDGKHINHVIDWDTLKLVFVIEDPKGNMYQFRMSEVKLTDAPDGVSGPEAITIAYPFTAFGENALDIIAIPSEAENRALAPIIEVVDTDMVLHTHPDYSDAFMYPDGAPSGYAMQYRLGGSPTWVDYTASVTLAEGTQIIEVRATATNMSPSVVVREEKVVAIPAYSYTVTFDVNGGEGANQTRSVVAPATTVDSLPTVTHLTDNFKEWNTQDDGGGAVFDLTTTVTGNITVYAIWE